jgi:hypothetical protein
MAEQKPSISVHNAEAHRNTPEIEHLTVTMPLESAKAEAIKRCVDKGQLRLTLTKVNLAAGRVGEAWEYD